MKKFSLIIIAIFITLALLSVTVYAESSDISQAVSTTSSNSGYSPTELAIISAIGVMFIKTVMKNNNNKPK